MQVTPPPPPLEHIATDRRGVHHDTKWLERTHVSENAVLPSECAGRLVGIVLTHKVVRFAADQRTPTLQDSDIARDGQTGDT